MLNTILLIFGFLNLAAAILAAFKVAQQQDKVTFIWWWGFVNGSFVWEDMLVFGLLHFLLVIISLALMNPVIWLICYLVFWIVRSAGETLYFFLQQFIVPHHHPHRIHAQIAIVRRFLGDISDQKCFIIAQVAHQSVLVLSIVGLILVLRS